MRVRARASRSICLAHSYHPGDHRRAETRPLVGDFRKLVPDLQDDAPGGTALRSGILARAIDEGDELCVDAIRDAAYYLGLGLASAINLLNPPTIILGGGVIESVSMLFDLASRRARQEALATLGNAVTIVRAKLGDNSGVVGAAIVGSRAS